MTDHSTQLFAKAQTLIPGGVNSPVRAFTRVGGVPLFFKQGIGPYLIDIDNKRYIDYVGAFGPLILGHAHPAVVEAIQKAATLGLGYGAPTVIEIEMAELLTTLMPSIEQVRMVNSGTEATQTAIRLARGYTNRNKILKFEGCYHGHTDSLLVKAGSGILTHRLPDSAGIPATFTEHTLIAPFNNLEAVQTLFLEYGEEIAAIIVEPIAGNMNCVLPIPGFLAGLQTLCQRYGSLLILDEVMTGFRVALGGAQALYHLKPDLTCLGKIIGGGLPVGAVGGKRDIMQCLAPTGTVYQAGTLSGNPITLAAGVATLKILQTPNLYDQLLHHTEYFQKGIQQKAMEYGIALHTHAVPGMLGLFFKPSTPIIDYQAVSSCDFSQFNQFFHGMLKEGIYLAPSGFETGFISMAHSLDIIDLTLHAAEQVFKRWEHTTN